LAQLRDSAEAERRLLIDRIAVMSGQAPIFTAPVVEPPAAPIHLVEPAPRPKSTEPEKVDLSEVRVLSGLEVVARAMNHRKLHQQGTK
jgi:hypothetical protein